MLVIGLIGKIGAGKSTVARRLAEHGAEVIDADAITHQVLEETAAKAFVVAAFGEEVLDSQGRVQRRMLAEKVFGPTPEHAARLAVLEAIIHPRVRQQISQRLEQVRAAELTVENREPRSGAVVVLDVPLLLQAGWDDLCQELIVVECDERVRLERLRQRSWSESHVEAREAAWGRQSYFCRVPERKGATVDAAGSLAYTFSQVDQLWSGFVAKYPTP